MRVSAATLWQSYVCGRVIVSNAVAHRGQRPAAAPSALTLPSSWSLSDDLAASLSTSRSKVACHAIATVAVEANDVTLGTATQHTR